MMTAINANLAIAIPEIFLTCIILLILLLDAFVKQNQNKELMIFGISAISLIVVMFLQIIVYRSCGSQLEILTFNNMFILDRLSLIMKVATYIAGFVAIVYSRNYIISKGILTSQFYMVFLFAILGMLVMISANNLLILYVGLELLSLSLYGLVALNYDNMSSVEAAMKFFILGALASGLLLYGISFIYGATGGCLQLDQVFSSIENNNLNYSFLVFGLVFIVAGLVFKLGLAPFHMWVPDVYEGSSLAVTMIIGTVTKIAAVVFMIRFLIIALGTLNHEWSLMLSALAFISLFLGNVIAIAQTNIKRMLGYSTIAHMGFIAFGIMTSSVSDISAVLFYLLTYVLTALAGFGVLIMLSNGNFECEKIEDLKGLNITNPLYAGIMLLVMFSLAGIPPLVGFYAKFKILEALIDAGFIKTSIYAVIMSLIGAFYYLRVVKVMYFDDKKLDLKVNNSDNITKSVLIINGVLILVLGVVPTYMLNICTLMATG